MTHDEQFHPMQNQWSCRKNRTVGFFLKPVFSKELVLLPPCWEKTTPKCPGDILALQIWFWTGNIIKTYQAHLPITHTSLQLENRPSKEFKLYFWHRSAEKQDGLFIYKLLFILHWHSHHQNYICWHLWYGPDAGRYQIECAEIVQAAAKTKQS